MTSTLGQACQVQGNMTTGSTSWSFGTSVKWIFAWAQLQIVSVKVVWGLRSHDQGWLTWSGSHDQGWLTWSGSHDQGLAHVIRITWSRLAHVIRITWSRLSCKHPPPTHTHTHSASDLYCDDCQRTVSSPTIHLQLTAFIQCPQLDYPTVCVQVR